MKKILLACGVALVVAALLLVPHGGSDAAAPPSSGTATDSAAVDAPGTPSALLQPSTAAARSEPVPIPGPSAAAAPFDLAAVLAAIAAAEAQGDERALETLLAQVVGDRARLDSVLALLESDDDASPGVRRGGIVTVAVAFARWSRGNGPDGLDGIPFCADVLQSLPRQPRETRELLIAYLAGTDAGEFPAIPGTMLPVILSLCRQHPDDASSYAKLLDRLGQDPGTLANHRSELLALILDTGHDELVAPALRALLALDPGAGVVSARALLEDAPRGSELHTLLVKSIATAAPAAVAVEVLVAVTDGSEFSAFEELARRPEARDEIQRRYSALVAADLDARARRALVASMSREETGTLLGIAGTDPSLEVRRQAFLTATVSRDVGPEGARAVREAYARRGTHGGIDARCAVFSAANVLLKSAGPARAEAVGLLGDIARDTSLPAADRRLALAKLRPHVPRESIADLEDLDAPTPQAGK